MATIGKARLKKLLSKGNLSGWEAGKLLVQEGYERAHGRQILTDVETANIRQSIAKASNKEIDDYNKLIDAGQILDYINLEGRVNCLYVTKRLEGAKHILADLVDDIRHKLSNNDRPTIVTERQFQEIVAKHREKYFNDNYPLDQVISWRALEIAPDDIKYHTHYPEHLEKEKPELYARLYKDAKEQIKKLISSGKIELTFFEDDLTPRQKKKIETLEAKVKREPLADKEWDTLLDKADISGEQLYNSGLPEWPRWIDGKSDFYDAETDNFYQVAIIQNPQPDQIDECGCYKESIIENLPPLLRFSINKVDHIKALALFEKGLQISHSEIRKFLSFKQVIEEFSEMAGLNLTEDIDRWYQEEVIGSINGFNNFLQAAKRFCNIDIVEPIFSVSHIPPITIEKLKPNPEALKILRNRLSSGMGTGGLGDNWWVKKSIAPEAGKEDSLDV